MPPSQRRMGADACPGALDVHRAADGGLARVRVPGGGLTSAQVRTLAGASRELGDGTLELTSRANLQVRGLAEGAEVELGARLAEAGLLPSLTHEKVRNIMSSPLGPPGLAAELDHELCGRADLAALPGRFLFAFDDGRGDVAWLGADLAALPVDDSVAILLGGADHGVRVQPDQVIETMLAAAAAFLELRDEQWRVAELPAERIASLFDRTSERVTGEPPVVGPIGPVEFADGSAGFGLGAPLGRLTADQAARLGDLVLTPWRGFVVAGGDPGIEGLIGDPDSPWLGVTACTGRPGCAKSLADVRADARPLGRPAHWSGCDRRCGKPAGVMDVVATGRGYAVDGRLGL
ncbi:precorrin-3B synthase [Actinokineospora sp. HUAS TT18]|uniref:precorrin-3B synthase n=1 Tax=Actinokineospora sp. HUAS TT18 TaxID=3447451 RepID=UPI003F51C968